MSAESTQVPWTHRQYFRQFRLNVEQYGEILIAQAFGGRKEGDAQPCYDVEAPEVNIRSRLLNAGIPNDTVDACLKTLAGTPARIEVKSKLARTPAGHAHVIHCRDSKLEGVRGHRPATHFAVLLFDGEAEGIAEHAWFFSSEVARKLRRANTTSPYIAVTSLRNAPTLAAILDITTIVNQEAAKALFSETNNAAQQSAPADSRLAAERWRYMPTKRWRRMHADSKGGR